VYHKSLKHANIIQKSLHLWLAGDFKILSTFSNKTKAGFFSARISFICRHKTHFLPCIHFAQVFATE